MEIFRFNFNLLGCLSDLLDLSVAEIAKRCNFNQPTLRMYVRQERIIPVQYLLTLCNTLRMPMRHFFYHKEYVIPEREHATIEPSRWQPITWDYGYVEERFGDAPGHIYWKDVAKAMNRTDQKPRGRFALKTRFPVTEFLSVCNAFGLSPFDFIRDPNSLPKSATRASLPSRPGDILRDIDALRRELADTLAEIAALREEVKTLREAHDTLARRVSINIDTINNSHLSIAAEREG